MRAPPYIHVADAAPPACTTTTSTTTSSASTSTARPPDPGPDPAAGAAIVVDDPVISGPEAEPTRFTGVGWGGDLLRSFALGEGRSPVNGAEWSATVPAGVYRVEAFIPREHPVAHVDHAVGHDERWRRAQVVPSRYEDTWVPLGTYSIGDGVAVVRSADATQVRARRSPGTPCAGCRWADAGRTELAPPGRG